MYNAFNVGDNLRRFFAGRKQPGTKETKGLIANFATESRPSQATTRMDVRMGVGVGQSGKVLTWVFKSGWEWGPKRGGEWNGMEARTWFPMIQSYRQKICMHLLGYCTVVR